MLVFFNKVEPVISFSATTTSHPAACLNLQFLPRCHLLHLFLFTMTSAPISVEFTVPLVPVEPMVSVDYYVYSWRIEPISTADCIFHSPQSLHLIAMPAPIYLKFLAGALADGQCWQCDWKSLPHSQDSLPIQSRKSCSVDDLSINRASC